MVMEVAIQQRDIEMLPTSGPFAVKQGRTDGAHRVDSGTDVTKRNHREVRGPTRLTTHRGYARIGRAEIIESRFVRERSTLPEGGHRAHDNFRIDRADGFITEP